MTREAKQDLEALKSYVNSYSLASVASKPEYNRQLAQLHRSYLSLLVFIAELDDQFFSLKKTSKALDYMPSEMQSEYIRESGSDIGQAIFCWMHGGYKASGIVLRSSIETFIKGLVCVDEPSVLTETRLYQMFEAAGKVPFFATDPGQKLFAELNSKYGELSSDVHTATIANMNRISALSYFPAFNAVASTKPCDNIVYVTARMVVILCVRYNVALHAMHHRNKETILDSVPPGYKKRIQNIE